LTSSPETLLLIGNGFYDEFPVEAVNVTFTGNSLVLLKGVEIFLTAESSV
jgi:hypothetical protein